MANDHNAKTVGVFGALSIGVGAIIGGGFFATFGITVVGAKGATPISFLIAGVIALFTAYSYIGLTLRYPGPGGTVKFITTAFGTGLLTASVNTLLVLGLVNFAGASLMERLEGVFNVGKLAVLGLFIVGGFLVGDIAWARLEPAAWAPPSAIVSSGMLGFLAYEGFELIANASDDIADPKRTLPIGFLGSVAMAIVVYVLAFIVGIGHLPFHEMLTAKDYAISAAAGNFLGPIGFAIMAVGAVLAAASAINADYFGAAKLPLRLATINEMPSVFHRSLHGQSIWSLVLIGALALAAVNFASIEAMSSATSGGFLIVYAVVNVAAVRLAPETGATRWIAVLATLLCLAALIVTIYGFLSDPATVSQAVAIAAIVAVSIVVEVVYRLSETLSGRVR